MRIVSLRAPLAGSVPIELHPRLTVVAGATTSDRLALQSVFRALVGADASRLATVLEVNGVTVELDGSFADTFATRASTDPVLVVGDVQAQPFGTPSAAVEEAVSSGETRRRLDSLRAEQRALAGELDVLSRELAAERTAVAPGRHAGVAWSPLVDSLREALASGRAGSGADAAELAERLERLGSDEVTDGDRSAALEQLLVECRQAIEAVQSPSATHPTVDPSRLAALEQVKEEMLLLSSAGRLSRRDRQHLEHLRDTEARLLAELGHPTYMSVLASLAEPVTGAGDQATQRRARASVLSEIEAYLLERLADSIGGAGRQRLLGEAAALLGEPPGGLEGRDPRLVAGRLRALPRGDLTDALRLASALERELGLDTAVSRTPEQVLEIALARLAGAAEARRGPDGGSSRVEELERRRREVSMQLRELTDALGARERAATVGQRAVAGGAGEVSGLFAAPDARRPPDLASAVDAARSVSVVGALPLLLLEAAARPDQPTAAGALPEPLTVAAMSAVTQLVWVTDRAEVVAAVEALGPVAAVIRV